MKSYNSVFNSVEHKSRSCICTIFVIVPLLLTACFLSSAWLQSNSLKSTLEIQLRTPHLNVDHDDCEISAMPRVESNNTTTDELQSDKCNDKCKPFGTEALPEGIVSKTSNLVMQPLWGYINVSDKKPEQKKSLLAIAIGIKQKVLVDKIIKKFIDENFSVILFHYDGLSDEWKDLEWNDKAIHISAQKQTKWWFAKRFLHPDIVDEYEYIFLWDEDLGVENFHPTRYVSIIKEEGLEISQPALDRKKSEIHHQITARNKRTRVHRRYYRNGRCEANSENPPCVGWVELMAPVFSKSAWRCAWYMIQNDMIHAWGLDKQLGYCAQGDRKQNVGVVDEEYIVHIGLPTLGSTTVKEADHRVDVRSKSYREMKEFKDRWNMAAEKDACWIDPYKSSKED